MINGNSSRFDVICLGLIVADQVCAPIRKIPAPGGLITTNSLELSIGGCAANTSTDLAILGISVALVGCVGDDPLGEFVINELRAKGVDCNHVHISPTQQTAATMVINVQDEDRRFIHAVGANTELTGQEVSDELLQSSQMIAVGGFGLNPQLSGQNIQQLFTRAKRFGVTTVLDVVLDDVPLCREMLRAALPVTDYFLPNLDEARLLTGQTSASEQIRTFHDWGASTVIITSGAQGAFLGTPSADILEQPAFQVQQVDGTGGGDAFLSGFLFGLFNKKSLRDCLVYGSAMGASCVQHAGATTGVFNARQLNEFVKSHCSAD